MTTKLTVTIKADKEMPSLVAQDRIGAVLNKLANYGGLPLRGFALTIETLTESQAEDIRVELRELTRRRPVGVEVEFAKLTKEVVERESVPAQRPMEDLWAPSAPRQAAPPVDEGDDDGESGDDDDAGSHEDVVPRRTIPRVESVTLSHRDRSVTLTAETAANAAAMLHAQD